MMRRLDLSVRIFFENQTVSAIILMYHNYASITVAAVVIAIELRRPREACAATSAGVECSAFFRGNGQTDYDRTRSHAVDLFDEKLDPGR
jgi:hypothetical protein